MPFAIDSAFSSTGSFASNPHGFDDGLLALSLDDGPAHVATTVALTTSYRQYNPPRRARSSLARVRGCIRRRHGRV